MYRMKRHKSALGANIHVFLILIISIQLPYFIFFATIQVSSASNNDASQHFNNIDFTNITFLDLMARKAMKHLHDDLDHDDDGNVSLSEGAQFIDREDFESRSSNLPGFATDKDGRITESEFWETWVASAVHNWTVSEMVEWLSSDVDLPQYAEKFKLYGISGAAMPILLDPDFNVLKNIGITPNAHKRKIQLRTTEIVLFGPPKSKSNLFKDILLTVSIALALSGMAYAVHVRRSATAAVVVMQEKLNNLQKEMSKLDEDAAWTTKPSTSDDYSEGGLVQREFMSSQASLHSEVSLQSRLHEVMDELSDARSMLERAEERLNDQKWLPPDRLIVCLKVTNKVETKLHESKRQQAQKKVDQAKSQFLKMKKKTSIFTSVQLVHSHQVDNFDLEVQAAKDFLSEVQRETHEFKKRWFELEKICKCRFITSSSRLAAVVKHHPNENDVSMTYRPSINDASVPRIKNETNLNSNEIHPHKNNEKTMSMTSQQSCPSLVTQPDRRLIASPTSPSLIHPRTSSFNKVTSSGVIDRERFSDRFRSLPRRLPSPLLSGKKNSISSQKLKSSESKQRNSGESNHERRQSLDPNGDVRLKAKKKSASTHSLPDLIAEDVSTTIENNSKPEIHITAAESEIGKPNKKRSFFGNKFKKIIKS